MKLDCLKTNKFLKSNIQMQYNWNIYWFGTYSLRNGSGEILNNFCN